MSESTQHIELVGRIIPYISTNLTHLDGLVVIHDLPSSLGDEKPPRVGGYVPDVYGIRTPATFTVIGEAKTFQDLETSRSRSQLGAYLSFLASEQDGLLLVSVPWVAAVRARILLGQLSQDLPKKVKTIVLDGVTA